MPIPSPLKVLILPLLTNHLYEGSRNSFNSTNSSQNSRICSESADFTLSGRKSLNSRISNPSRLDPNPSRLLCGRSRGVRMVKEVLYVGTKTGPTRNEPSGWHGRRVRRWPSNHLLDSPFHREHRELHHLLPQLRRSDGVHDLDTTSSNIKSPCTTNLDTSLVDSAQLDQRSWIRAHTNLRVYKSSTVTGGIAKCLTQRSIVVTSGEQCLGRPNVTDVHLDPKTTAPFTTSSPKTLAHPPHALSWINP